VQPLLLSAGRRFRKALDAEFARGERFPLETSATRRREDQSCDFLVGDKSDKGAPTRERSNVAYDDA